MIAVLVSTNSFCGGASNSFVQFRILTITDAKIAEQIDDKMSSRSGVLESRTDYITSTYFCLLTPDAEYTKDDFVNWFAKFGLKIACYFRGIQGTDVMLSPHELKKCEDVAK